MSKTISFEGARSDDLLGLTEYYDTVLSGNGLVTKESEFRTSKLSLILDFIKTTSVPEKLRADLISAIIDAWRLQIPERTLRQREEELKMVLSSIKSIRNAVKWIKRSAGPAAGGQLDIAILSDLPLTPSDLRSEDVPMIYDLLSQVMDYSMSLTRGNLGLRPEAD